jgi:hypothetical protein
MDDELLTAKKEAWRLCGTTNLIQAFKQIEAERISMLTLHDRNSALALHIRRLDEILRTTNTIISGVEETGQMFLATSTRNAINRYRELYADVEKRLQEALSL